jgi:hypothetical protein
VLDLILIVTAEQRGRTVLKPGRSAASLLLLNQNRSRDGRGMAPHPLAQIV